MVFLRFIDKRCKNPDRNITSCFVVIVVNDNHNVPIFKKEKERFIIRLFEILSGVYASFVCVKRGYLHTF